MKTTKKFIKAVKADLAKSNVYYSNIWRVAEMQRYIGKLTYKTYAALVYLHDRADSEPVFRIYYNFDGSMGDEVDYVVQNTNEEANKQFLNMLILHG